MTPRRLFPVLVVLLLAPSSLAQDELFPDEPEILELKPGEKRSFTYIAEVDGEASIWARSETLDVTLEVLDKAGNRRKFDDDSGGGKASHFYLPVKNEVEYSVVVAAKPMNGEGVAATVTVTLFEAPVNEAVMALVKRVETVVAAMKELRADEEYEEARNAGAAVLTDVRNFSSTFSVWAMSLHRLASEHRDSMAPGAAIDIWKRAIEIFERTLPSDHPGLQAIRMNYAGTLFTLGDLAGAKAHYGRVLAARERTLPSDNLELQKARMGYAVTLFSLGDLVGAKAHYERVLAVYERTLSSDHPDLQAIRLNYAGTLFTLGDLAGAKALYESVLAVGDRTLPPDHLELQKARMGYAFTLRSLGDLAGAKELEKRVLALYERTLPSDHSELQAIRLNHATTLRALGDLAGAKELEERVLTVYERTLPSDHPDLQAVRQNYANTLFSLGDLAGAKALREQVLAVRERTLPSDHPDLQTIRVNYADTLFLLGDLAGAKALQELVLAVYDRTLPSDHPELLMIRTNYAVTLFSSGDLVGAKALNEKVLAVYERILPPDHPNLQTIRANYADTLGSLGDLAGAKALQERVLAAYERTLPSDHLDLQGMRANYAITLFSLGDLAGAKALQERVLTAYERALPSDHLHLLAIRVNYADTLFSLVREGESRVAVHLRDHLESLLDESIESCENSIERLSSRQVAAGAMSLRRVLDRALSFADPVSSSRDRAGLRLTEQLRGLASRARRLSRLRSDGSEPDEVNRFRADLAVCRKSIEGFLADPDLEDDAPEDETITSRLAELVRRKETAERALRHALRRHPAAAEILRAVSVEEIASALPRTSAAVSFSSYVRSSIEENGEDDSEWKHEEHLVAMVLDVRGKVTRCDLGPSETVSKLVAHWRALIGAPIERGVEVEEDDRERLAAKRGREIRRRILDPVLAVIGEGVTRLVVTLAGDLHLIGLDSLPLDDDGCVGDKFEINVVNGLEWLVRMPHGDLNRSGFVGFGSADFLDRAKPLEDAEVAMADSRGVPAWKDDFRDLPFTKTELLTLGMTYERAFGDDEKAAPPKIFLGREVDKQRIRLFAPKARYLHLATHGWFAPESIASILDKREFKGLANPMITDLRDEVRGYEPLALCGLALTGANLKPREDGSHPGLLTGAEIADLDLSCVELAVLSACETNVGVRRAGQGIMSLQEALFSAGVRYSITSLWKVPDEATMELMTRFYEGIWRRGETKREALWSAKLKIRNAKDSRTGNPKFGLRDWAGWVLYGNPE